MLVLVATKETQGQRANDFCHANEGEIVKTHLECDGETIDGSCGCRRSLSGVESLKSTTTFKVADLPLDMPAYVQKIKDSYIKGGWILNNQETRLDNLIKDNAKEMAETASYFGLNTILEKRGRNIRERISRSSIKIKAS